MAVMAVLSPYLLGLTEEERKSLFSLAEENLVFADDALTQAQALGSLLPPQLSGLVGNLENDLRLFRQLDMFEKEFIVQVTQQVADTKRVAAHEAFVGGLAIYKIIEALASVGVTGAQAAYDILKVRFANQGGGGSQPNP